MLSYRCYGEPKARQLPIVIIHGLLGSKENWHSQAELLAAQHEVITVDVRNHGQSPHLRGMSYESMADDVFALLDHLGVAQIKLIGHSMGGKIAMRMAFRHALRIERLLVVDIAPRQYPLHHQSTLTGMLHFPLEKLTSRQQADTWMQKLVDDAFQRKFLLKNLRRDPQSRLFYWQCHLAEISRHYLKIADFPIKLTDSLYPYQSCFIRGELSDYIQPHDHELIYRYFPEATIITIKDSGHSPHMEQIDAFYQNAAEFMQ
ncbi:MAG: alpha/beta fold hydrolase [bacterium]